MYLSDVCTIPSSLAGPARRCRSRAASPTACRSGCRSSARPSARTACSTWPTRSRARSASTRGRRGCCDRRAWEPVIGLEIHVQLSTRTKMFCGCELSFGDPPNTHTCPVCLAHPGALPVTNREAVRLAILAGLALGCDVPPRVGVPPQELLLSRPLEGVPDLPVRRAALRRRARRRAAAGRPRARGGHHPRAPRGGRGQARARRRGRAARRAPRPRASTSTAAARRCSRSSPSPTCARPPTPAPSCASSARRCARLERERLQHGGGLAARRRQRERAAGGLGGARHQGRAEEHEQLPLPRARHRGRDRPPGRRCSRPAGGWCRRRCTSTPTRARSTPCAARRRRTTTATSRSPTWCRWRPTRPGSRSCARGLPELPVDRRRRWVGRAGAHLRGRRGAVGDGRARRLLRGRRRPGRPEGGGQLDPRRAARPAPRGGPGAVGEPGDAGAASPS